MLRKFEIKVLAYVINEVILIILNVNVIYLPAPLLKITLDYFHYRGSCRYMVTCSPRYLNVIVFNSNGRRVLLIHMLGLPLYNIYITRPACNKALLDIYVDHSLNCRAGSERTRHNYV